MGADVFIQILISLGLLSGIGAAYKAWVDSRTLKAQTAIRNADADSTTATATALVIEAARELVDPLRKELAEVRKEARTGLEAERVKLAEVRVELTAATNEARELRIELAKLRNESATLRLENQTYRERIAELERIQG